MRPALHMHIGRQTRERPAGCKVPALSLLHLQGRSHCSHCFIHFMFTYSATRTSAACQFVHVDLLRGVATVSFNNGHMYEYKNVSRRAIVSLMANPNMSLGFWVNHNLLDTPRTSYKVVPDLTAGLPA